MPPKKRLVPLLAALLLALGLRVAVPAYRRLTHRIEPLDSVPAQRHGGLLDRNGPHVVLHVAGTPEEMGRQHGALLAATIKQMLELYILNDHMIPNDPGNWRRQKLVSDVRTMRSALPAWFLAECDACADAAGVDRDVLLMAQCEGDLKDAAWDPKAGGAPLPERFTPAPDAPDPNAPAPPSEAEACSSYVAFGPATAGGNIEAGRNFDYGSAARFIGQAGLVTRYRPAEGHRFVAVGWAGILTGWTLINEHGLIVANHLGGGKIRRVAAVPTLILARMVAQHAATVDEAVAIIRETPRMRGQIIWIAQPADPASGRTARAVAVEYDAQDVAVREAENGLLLVTNTNRALRGSVPESEVPCHRYKRLRRYAQESYGRLDGSEMLTARRGVVLRSTVHIVQFLPSERVFLLRHGLMPASKAATVRHPLPGTE